MKNKRILLTVLLVIILTIYIILICKLDKKNNITLIQLSPQSSTQMMGYIIKTKNDQIIVVDGGTSADKENFEKYINEFGGRVDYWFLTHAHMDHASVLVDIINDGKIEIGTIYASLNEKAWYEQNEPQRQEFSFKLLDTLNNEGIKEKVKSPKINDNFKIDGINVEILGIRNPEIIENAGNEQSMVIKFDTGKTTILFLGDTGVNSSKKLLDIQKEKLKSDIVQMAHHGQAGATKELYEVINPKVCLWPTPEWLWKNDSGVGENTGPWKTLETRKWIEELGITKNYIAKDGDIILKIK